MRRVLILGAAGRDFHNFNVAFRDNPRFHVVAFTATQIPDIANRRYPAELAGSLYPDGIPIHPEEELECLVREGKIDVAVFSYSDVAHEQVMHLASRVVAAGADFWLLGAEHTQLPARVPVVSVCAVRTGCGKSPVSRRVAAELRRLGWKFVVVRHPMPYGDLSAQRLQRFASLDDLERHRCTIEEREEYEPHLARGAVVYAGVDYRAILRQAEQEADLILWDGGNNDTPFFRSDLEIVVADPHRAGHELAYYPGEVNFRRAHVIVINKVDSAEPARVEAVKENIRRHNPAATVIEAACPVGVAAPELRQPVEDPDEDHWARRAQYWNLRLVQGRRVRLEQDALPRDRQGHLLAYVFTEEGTFVNAWLIEFGFAEAVRLPPNLRYQEQFVRLERLAREKARGLWGRR